MASVATNVDSPKTDTNQQPPSVPVAPIIPTIGESVIEILNRDYCRPPLDQSKILWLKSQSYEKRPINATIRFKIRPHMGITFVPNAKGGQTPIYLSAYFGITEHTDDPHVLGWDVCHLCQTTEFQAHNFHTDKLLASARVVDLTSQNYYFTHLKKFNHIYWKDAIPHYGEKRNMILIEGFQSFGKTDATEALLKAITQKFRYSCSGRLLVDISDQCKARLTPKLKRMGFENTNTDHYLYLPEKNRQRWLQETDQNKIAFFKFEQSQG
jgi:hypothetical protein